MTAQGRALDELAAILSRPAADWRPFLAVLLGALVGGLTTGLGIVVGMAIVR